MNEYIEIAKHVLELIDTIGLWKLTASVSGLILAWKLDAIITAIARLVR